MEIAFEKGEIWWGGASAGRIYPLKETDRCEENLIDGSTSASNQSMPLFVSSHGRYMWSSGPFSVTVRDGAFRFEGAHPAVKKAGTCLREAYLSAQREHFPCDGRALTEAFFTAPQLNTWMEYGHDVTQRGVLDLARGWIDSGYAPGVLIVDDGWQENYGVWEFDRAAFPDPGAMVRQLHEWGFKVLLWVVPYVSADGPEPVRRGLRARGGEAAVFSWWNGYGALLDMREESDCAFLRAQLSRLMREYGIDGFKFDGGSVRGYSPASLINGPLAEPAAAVDLNRAWNEFGAAYEYHEFKDTYGRGGRNTIQRLRDKRHLWQLGGLDDLIPCAINAGLMGYPFLCPDMIGGGEWRDLLTPGFRVDEELFVRMAQCSALFPMMQFSRAPWRALSKENARLCLEAARLHGRMLPEIMRVVRASLRSGEPVVRSLEYECPHHGFETVTDEFMLGSGLLVAPVLEKGARAREVAFPEGTWRGMDGREYAGLTRQTVSAPLDTLPWFMRVG